MLDVCDGGGLAIWVFIAMIRDEMTKGTNLDEKEV